MELDLRVTILAEHAVESAHLVRVESKLGHTVHRLVDPFLEEWFRVPQEAP
ncbi:MAG: hypothetical protein ACOC9H_01310 [Gemmatimonadota bacterium]